MGRTFNIMKAQKIDKNNIYTYISRLTLIKIVIYLVQSLHICLEKEKDGFLPLLDINISHEIGKFATKVY